MAPTTYKLRVDSEQLAVWQKTADKAGLKLAEWMRRKCDEVPAIPGQAKEKIDEAGGGEDVQRVPNVPAPERRAAVPREPAPPRPKTESAGPLFGGHPGAGIFNAAQDLSEPQYKSHDADCGCFLCESAIKAGLKPDKRAKKEEKKPAKRGRR